MEKFLLMYLLLFPVSWAKSQNVPTIPYSAPSIGSLCNEGLILNYPTASDRPVWYGDYTDSRLYSGDPIRIGCDPGVRGRKVRITIRHANGGKLPETGFPPEVDPEQLNEVVYDRIWDGCDRPDASDVFRNTCGKYGAFKIEVVIERQKKLRACPARTTERYCLMVVVLPRLIPPAIPNVLEEVRFACPNSDVTLQVDPNVPGQNDIRWYYSDLQLTEDFKEIPNSRGHYTIQYTADYIEPRLVEPVYGYKYQSGCEMKGIVNGRFKIIPVNIHDLEAPAPQFQELCAEGQHTFHIANPYNAKGVKWYRDAYGNDEVTEGVSDRGFTFSRHYAAPVTTFYISYFDDSYADCPKQSLRSPVTVCVIPAQVFPNLGQGTLTHHEIYDHRDYQQDCHDNPLYYHNLADGLPDLEVNTQTPHVLSTLTKMQVTSNRQVWEQSKDNGQTWTRTSYVQPIYYQWPQTYPASDILAVCSDNLFNTRLHYNQHVLYRLNVVTSYEITHTLPPAGTPTYKTGECQITGVRQKDIVIRKLVNEECQPPTLDVIRRVAGEMLTDGCEDVEVVTICPGEKKKIGPSDEEIRKHYAEMKGLTDQQIHLLPQFIVKDYTWSPPEGLDNPKISQPQLIYQEIPSPKDQLSRYVLTITFLDNQTATYCVLVYKCSACLGEPPQLINP